MPNLEKVLEIHEQCFARAKALVQTKGHDYNREQAASGDQLFNMRIAKMLGVTDTHTQSVMVRFTDKVMRIISLAKNPDVNPQVKDESVQDTVCDLINYAIYIFIFYLEFRGAFDKKVHASPTTVLEIPGSEPSIENPNKYGWAETPGINP